MTIVVFLSIRAIYGSETEKHGLERILVTVTVFVKNYSAFYIQGDPNNGFAFTFDKKLSKKDAERNQKDAAFTILPKQRSILLIRLFVFLVLLIETDDWLTLHLLQDLLIQPKGTLTDGVRLISSELCTLFSRHSEKIKIGGIRLGFFGVFLLIQEPLLINFGCYIRRFPLQL